ncbi:MAG TPA: histidinol-phosphatase HisJ family protein [Clostridia bacterium]|nr:histidinol-phosphatase HisJ family protein [Clostridia bacterium]
MYDFHTHSHYSTDSSASMLSMARKGKNIGLSGICFTDHIDLDYENPQASFDFSYGDYISEISNIRASLPGNFEIFAGVELGLQPHTLADNQELIRDRSYDFIIGSIHCVNKTDMYLDGFLKSMPTDDMAVTNYFMEMQLCIESFSNFDVLGHLDGVRRYIRDSESFSYEQYREQIQNALKSLIRAHKGIEVNTSGLRYGLSSFHPLPEILRLYKQLGGEIVTIGSDSHSPDTLGYRFKEAGEMLSDMGFKYYTIFKNRKPVFIKL